MTATNVSVEQLIRVLNTIRNSGSSAIDIELIIDDENPSMNKLILHPIKDEQPKGYLKDSQEIKNPDIDKDNNDIFDYFNKIL